MWQSGVELAEGLLNIAQQCPRPALRTVQEQVDADVSSGSAFSEALRKHPSVFDETFLAGIAAGEQTGSITQVLERLTNLIRSDMRMRSTVWSMESKYRAMSRLTTYRGSPDRNTRPIARWQRSTPNPDAR